MADSITWIIKPFCELTTNELYDALKLRIDVFVVEQTCYYPDLDDLDRHVQTRHLLAYKDNELLGYLRILPAGTSYPGHIAIGRVATAGHARGSGLGHQLIEQALKVCEQVWPTHPVKMSAQEHLEAFYNQHGFVRTSDMYLEDDIPHIAMELQRR